MKLSSETLAVLKNFVSINASIEFKTGNKLATISPTKTVLAKATIKDTFPQDFCIHDLNQFLSVHSLDKDCDKEAIRLLNNGGDWKKINKNRVKIDITF